jgi:hypothetical protein
MLDQPAFTYYLPKIINNLKPTLQNYHERKPMLMPEKTIG